MKKQGLKELISKINIKLKEYQYSHIHTQRLKTTWNHLHKYMVNKKHAYYTAKVGIDFIESQFGITVYKKLKTKMRHNVRAINLLSDYLLHGVIFARTKIAIRRYSPQFEPIFQRYINKKISEGTAASTIASSEIYLSRFSTYMNGLELKKFNQLNEGIIIRFSNTFTRYSPAVIHCTLCALRVFLRFLFETNIIKKDLSYAVPTDGYRKISKVPSAYSKSEITQLLDAIDRGSPKGKRDFAIIMIADRLGLRAQDICDLTFSNLKWETNSIELIQKKTKEPIVLPLLEDVGLAIIDYLKYGRQDFKTSKAIFLRLTPPIGKLEAPTLHSIVSQSLRKAGIKLDNGKKHGPHALRHSLASVLLEESIPLPIISSILGHTSSASTLDYLKIDITQLKTCAIEPPVFDWNKGEESF